MIACHVVIVLTVTIISWAGRNVKSRNFNAALKKFKVRAAIKKRAEYRFGSLAFKYDIAALDYSHREKVTVTSPLPRASAQPVRSSMRPRRV